jgi:adenylylsulfate kinase
MNFCLWVTGPPGSGKSTIIEELKGLFASAGLDFLILELDQIRKFLTPEPKYNDQEREIVYRSLVLMAQLLVEHGGKRIIIDATGNRRAFRNLARQRIIEFAEVYMKCPLQICRSREASRKGGSVEKNLYQKAEAGQLEGDLPGISAPYEEPRNPEILIPSDRFEPGESAKKIMGYVSARWLS